ncbi:dual specificity protein phosphatase 19 [Sigmodon hispidus]
MRTDEKPLEATQATLGRVATGGSQGRRVRGPAATFIVTMLELDTEDKPPTPHPPEDTELPKQHPIGPCFLMANEISPYNGEPGTAGLGRPFYKWCGSHLRVRLQKQCTRVTTLTGKKIIETWTDATVHVVEAEPSGGVGCGYVQDLSLDLQVGVIKPWLLLGSQDVAHDLELLRKHKIQWNRNHLSHTTLKSSFFFLFFKVTHILNVAYGVENAFLGEFTYKTISILDVPETNILSYFPECFEFIEQARRMGGVVLVHCNAGVSRAAAIVIGFLMSSEEIEFTSALSLVKDARPSICPNPGFIEQLRTYQVGKESHGGDQVLSVDRGHGP